jgi:hypothetical protein
MNPKSEPKGDAQDFKVPTPSSTTKAPSVPPAPGPPPGVPAFEPKPPHSVFELPGRPASQIPLPSENISQRITRKVDPESSLPVVDRITRPVTLGELQNVQMAPLVKMIQRVNRTGYHAVVALHWLIGTLIGLGLVLLLYIYLILLKG